MIKIVVITLTIITIPISFILGGLTALVINGGVNTTYEGEKGKSIGDSPRKRVINHSPMGLKYYLRKLKGKVK